MAGGRRPLGVKLVDGLAGSREARGRLKVILETLLGARSIDSAAEELGINRSRVHQLRAEALGGALGALEAKPVGRPPKGGRGGVEEREELLGRLEALTARCQDLELELKLSGVREELQAVMPKLRKGAEKKTPQR